MFAPSQSFVRVCLKLLSFRLIVTAISSNFLFRRHLCYSFLLTSVLSNLQLHFLGPPDLVKMSGSSLSSLGRCSSSSTSLSRDLLLNPPLFISSSTRPPLSSYLTCTLHCQCKSLSHTCQFFLRSLPHPSLDVCRTCTIQRSLPFTFLSTHLTFAAFSSGLPEPHVRACSPFFSSLASSHLLILGSFLALGLLPPFGSFFPP